MLWVNTEASCRARAVVVVTVRVFDGTDCATTNYSSLAIRLRTCRRGNSATCWTHGYRWMRPVTHLPYALADRHAHQRLSFISAPPTGGRASCGLRHTRIGQGLQLTRSAEASRDDQQPHGSDASRHAPRLPVRRRHRRARHLSARLPDGKLRAPDPRRVFGLKMSAHITEKLRMESTRTGALRSRLILLMIPTGRLHGRGPLVPSAHLHKLPTK